MAALLQMVRGLGQCGLRCRMGWSISRGQGGGKGWDGVAEVMAADGAKTAVAAKPGHYPALDSLRGVAALLVVFHHLGVSYRDLFNPQGLAGLITKAVIYPGHPAVLMFFVLSGFVLQLSHGRASSNQYWHYVLRRTMRIFPAMLASLVLAVVLLRPATEYYGPWLLACANGDHSWTGLLRNASLLLTRSGDASFNVVLWSLAYEWRVSLVFPLLAILAIRYPWYVAAAMLPVYVLARFGLVSLGFDAPYIINNTTAGTILVTFFYLPAFLMGMLLAVWIGKRQSFPRIPLWLEGLWLLAVVAPYYFVKEDFALALGAALLIALIVCGGRLNLLLRNAAALWLGKVSYSLYLVHFPIVMFFVSFYPTLPFAAVVALTLVSSLALAEVFHRFVELPGIRLGKTIGSLANRRAARPSPTAAGAAQDAASSPKGTMPHALAANDPQPSPASMRVEG